MQITALRPEDLPFSRVGTAACTAARAGDVTMKLPGFPGEFRVRFTGTGVAVIPESTQEVFDVNNERSSVDMEWYDNKFVGRHWLLGDFKITLADDQPSTGTIRVIKDSEFGPNTVNTNDFFFDFAFKRFPFLNMANVTPIRNTGVIAAVPPIGSVFKLDKPDQGAYKFSTGSRRTKTRDSAPTRNIDFNQCDVVVFPEQNVGLTFIYQKRVDANRYAVAVEIENITSTKATFAHFSVIHYAGITIDNDYGFVLLKAGRKATITYHVTSSVKDRTVDLPFFAALYEPSRLNGSKSLRLVFDF